jgi:hypothetical protein
LPSYQSKYVNTVNHRSTIEYSPLAALVTYFLANSAAEGRYREQAVVLQSKTHRYCQISLAWLRYNVVSINPFPANLIDTLKIWRGGFPEGWVSSYSRWRLTFDTDMTASAIEAHEPEAPLQHLFSNTVIVATYFRNPTRVQARIVSSQQSSCELEPHVSAFYVSDAVRRFEFAMVVAAVLGFVTLHTPHRSFPTLRHCGPTNPMREGSPNSRSSDGCPFFMNRGETVW